MPTYEVIAIETFERLITYYVEASDQDEAGKEAFRRWRNDVEPDHSEAYGDPDYSLGKISKVSVPSEYKIEITRISYGNTTTLIKASSEEEAIDKAINSAGDFIYSEYDAEYEIASAKKNT